MKITPTLVALSAIQVGWFIVQWWRKGFLSALNLLAFALLTGTIAELQS